MVTHALRDRDTATDLLWKIAAYVFHSSRKRKKKKKTKGIKSSVAQSEFLEPQPIAESLQYYDMWQQSGKK